jgi:hypothetical protein
MIKGIARHNQIVNANRACDSLGLQGLPSALKQSSFFLECEDILELLLDDEERPLCVSQGRINAARSKRIMRSFISLFIYGFI